MPLFSSPLHFTPSVYSHLSPLRNPLYSRLLHYFTSYPHLLYFHILPPHFTPSLLHPYPLTFPSPTLLSHFTPTLLYPLQLTLPNHVSTISHLPFTFTSSITFALSPTRFTPSHVGDQAVYFYFFKRPQYYNQEVLSHFFICLPLPGMEGIVLICNIGLYCVTAICNGHRWHVQ